MIPLAVGGYTAEQIMAQLHSRHGSREVKYRYDLLNRRDVRLGELAVTSASITFSSLAQLKRTARLSLRESEAQDVDWLNDRVQPWFCLRMPDGGWAEWPLGVFLMSSPSREESGGGILREVEAYDTSLVLKEDKFADRYYIPAGTRYIEAIRTIMGGAGIWKVNITPHDGQLGAAKEFEVGSEKLTAVNELLSELNYTSIWVDENGYCCAVPYVLPTDREAEYIYRDDDLSVIHDGARETLDLFAVPNRWIVVASNPDRPPLVSSYTNDLSTSSTSTVGRGRVITDYREIDDILDQSTLDDYTRRIAYAGSQIYGKVEFDTAVMPHHSYSDVLYIDHRRLGVAAKYIETSWTMDLKAGGSMQHSVRRVVYV